MRGKRAGNTAKTTQHLKKRPLFTDGEGKPKTKKKAKGKGKKKKKNDSDKSHGEDSDDGDFEGLEVDYISDETRYGHTDGFLRSEQNSSFDYVYNCPHLQNFFFKLVFIKVCM